MCIRIRVTVALVVEVRASKGAGKPWIVQKFAFPADLCREAGAWNSGPYFSSHLLGSEMRLVKGLKTLNRLDKSYSKQELAAYWRVSMIWWFEMGIQCGCAYRLEYYSGAQQPFGFSRPG